MAVIKVDGIVSASLTSLLSRSTTGRETVHTNITEHSVGWQGQLEGKDTVW